MDIIAAADQRFEQLWLPLWPLASDDLHAGIYRMSRRSALGCKYIEANPHAISNLLVVDIDHTDALVRSIENAHDWLPNAVVENPHNGHAHAVWALREPITRTEYARRKPLAYAAAITEGLRRKCGGDQGYSGLITKNPEHVSWDGYWFSDNLYTLPQLNHYLTDAGYMPPQGWQRTRRKNPVGLGRNCSLFETVRTWAYSAAKQIRKRNEYATPADSHDLYTAITTTLSELNTQFTEPLPTSEMQAIGRSIHKWITTRFYGWTDSRTIQEASLTTLQSVRGKKGGLTSGTNRKHRAKTLFEES